MAANQLYYFHVLILLSAIFFIICTSANADCQYTVHVKTDPRRDAGTDSIISLSLYDNANFSGGGVVVKNLESWGAMGPGHDYFEGGNLDIFSGQAPCLAKPVCFMILKSDGTGNKPAVDEPPYSLTVYRNKCGNSKTMNISEDVPLPLSSVV
ncbi:UNVERIFIED_CONTAM: PLAT domain-containing protein 1 [Sesamum angustifolium]|uniref:PLAT domain-containing protein 1 n=1 Tax=Sesamum angustifolium TaxID=2727405 RepID=A0AAW2PGJ5_9LAMI